MVKELTEELGSQRGPERERGAGFIPHILSVLSAMATASAPAKGTHVYFSIAKAN